jgi:hypothetical protein
MSVRKDGGIGSNFLIDYRLLIIGIWKISKGQHCYVYDDLPSPSQTCEVCEPR